MQKRKKIKKLYILLPLIALLITVMYGLYGNKNEESIYTDSAKLMDTISNVIDLSTTKYDYNNIITIKKDKSFYDLKIPFTEKSYITKYNGVINAGVRQEDLKIVKNTKEEIIVEIEKCSILDHYIDDENIYIYDINNAIFNKVEIEEILSDISKYKEEYEKKLISEGFLKEVEVNTIKSLEEIFKSLGYKNVVINLMSDVK